MSITVIDYGSGNLKSAAKALETAANNIDLNKKILRLMKLLKYLVKEILVKRRRLLASGF